MWHIQIQCKKATENEVDLHRMAKIYPASLNNNNKNISLRCVLQNYTHAYIFESVYIYTYTHIYNILNKSNTFFTYAHKY